MKIINNNNNNPPRNLFENNAKYENKRSRNDVVIALMYISDLRLSNVEISVAHAASSVTQKLRRNHPVSYM